MFADLTRLVHDIAEEPARAYPRVVSIALIGTCVVVVLHFATVLLSRKNRQPGRAKWSIWERLIYSLALLSIVVLGATAFFSVIQYGAMEGWFLLAHTVSSGALIPLLLLLAITWAEANRFGRGTGSGRVAAETDSATPRPNSRFPGIAKLTFWIMLASGCVTASSMLASMLPVIGTDGLHRLLDVHRYGGLLLVVATMFHLYSVSLRCLGLR